LIKSRPSALADDYALLHDDDLLDEVFHRLKMGIYSELDDRRAKRLAEGQIPPAILREHGRVSASRHYFYVKHPLETGWLFERSGAGWIISRADKIVEENMFVRRGEPWDITAVFEASTRNGGASNVRVSSPKLRGDLLSFNIYLRKLLESIGSNGRETND
jgi:hypothetical protein